MRAHQAGSVCCRYTNAPPATTATAASDDEAPQDDESLSTTPATNASRSASEPSLT